MELGGAVVIVPVDALAESFNYRVRRDCFRDGVRTCVLSRCDEKYVKGTTFSN